MLIYISRTISLRTVELVDDREVELAKAEVELWTTTGQSSSSRPVVTPPTTLPFSIRLTPDLPQTVTTPYSSITHTLEAKLYPQTGELVKESTEVLILRYSSIEGLSNIAVDPVTTTVDAPSPATIQLPGTIFHVGDPIPIYITIPPPDPSSITSGLRLRNVKAELVREVQVGHLGNVASSSSPRPPQPSTSTSYPPEKVSHSSGAEVHSSVLSRSGAACRFHSERPLRIRLVLHDSDSLSNASGNITQSTLIHHIAFHVDVLIAFTASNHASSVAKVSFPVTIAPPLAPTRAGDFNHEIDAAYQKKHDAPPARTNRVQDESTSNNHGSPPAFDDVPGTRAYPPHLLGEQPPSSEHSAPPPPSFSPPSGSGFAAPPTFDEAAAASPSFGVGRPSQSQAPLPSFEESSRNYAGTTGELPSFTESMLASSSTAPVPGSSQDASPIPSGSGNAFSYWAHDPVSDRRTLQFRGEGEIYGFKESEQYDGISQSMMQTAGVGSPELSDVNSPSARMPPAQYEDRELDSIEILVGPPPGIEESLAAGVAAAFASENLAMFNEAVDDTEESGDVPPPPPPALDDPSDPPPTIDAYGGAELSRMTPAARSARTRAIEEAAENDLPGAGEDDGEVEGHDAVAAATEGPPGVVGHQEPPPYLGTSLEDNSAPRRIPRTHSGPPRGGGPPPYAG